MGYWGLTGVGSQFIKVIEMLFDTSAFDMDAI
jgi:hypothetical protein